MAMDIKETIGLALGVVKLDKEAIKKVAEDKDSWLPALIIIALASAFSNIGSLAVFAAPFLGIIGVGIITGIIFLVALILGGRGSYLSLFKVLGYASIIDCLAILPFLKGVLWIWILVVAIVALENLFSMTRAKAIITSSVIFILAVIIIAVVVALSFLTFGGLGYLDKIMGKSTQQGGMGGNVDSVSDKKAVQENLNKMINEQVQKVIKDGKLNTSPREGNKGANVNIPEDIPVYKGAKINFSVFSDDQGSLSLNSDDNTDKILEFYGTSLKENGWKSIKTGRKTEKNGLYVEMTANKDGRYLQVQLIPVKGKGASIFINQMKK